MDAAAGALAALMGRKPSHGVPMPHSEGCPGHNHRRRGDAPCPAFKAEDTERRRTRERNFPLGYCDYCGRDDVPMTSHDGKPICRRCSNRWQRRGFTGNGPGPEAMTALEYAQEHRHAIMTLSDAKAALELGRAKRSISRYRKLLRESSATREEDDEGCDEY